MRTALVLEEIPEMRRLFRVLLDRAGMRVVEAATAEQALEAVVENAEVALLVATQQPDDKDRQHVIRSLLSRSPGMAVLITSGYLLKPEELPPEATFFQKPFHPNDILQEVAKLDLGSD